MTITDGMLIVRELSSRLSIAEDRVRIAICEHGARIELYSADGPEYGKQRAFLTHIPISDDVGDVVERAMVHFRRTITIEGA